MVAIYPHYSFRNPHAWQIGVIGATVIAFPIKETTETSRHVQTESTEDSRSGGALMSVKPWQSCRSARLRFGRVLTLKAKILADDTCRQPDTKYIRLVIHATDIGTV